MTATTPTPLEVEVPSQNDESEEANADQSLDGQLSPTSLRRSTRTCALKAQEKLKVKEMVALDMTTRNDTPTENDGAQTSETIVDGEVPKKKRKLATGSGLDQYDCKFGIRLNANDEVVAMTDESDISSLNSEEVAELRDKYKLTKEQEAQMSEEIRRQREIQIREMESSLRLEEAKLTMIKKLRANQQTAQKAIQQQEAAKKFSSVVNQNSLGTAYKPTIATPATKVNGVSRTNKAPKPTNASPALSLTPQQQQILQRILTQSGGNPQQMAQLLKSLNPAALAALQQTVQAQQEASKQQQQQQQQQQQTAQAAAAKQSAADAARLARETAVASQQRINAARQQLRLHLEGQLKQVPLPKAPVQDLSFIPNGTQPDFCSLLGLDLCVQRVLKDKSVHKKVEVEPYVCEECGTDFTPVWKAIAGDKGDLHLYCEHCVRQAQKRKIRQDQMSMVRKAFQKMQEQEKEFERQVSSGKFGDPNPPVRPAAAATPPVATAPKPAATVTASPAAAVKTETATTSAANVHAKSPSVSAANLAQRTQTTPSSKAKRTSNAANAASALAALSGSPQLQQQLVTAAALRNMNPMLAAMVASQPQLMTQFQQMWMQMLQSQTQNRMPAAANNNQAMAALLQAVQSSQMQNTTSSASSNTNSGNAAMSQLLAAFTAQQSAALMGGLGGNNAAQQQLLRAAQLQQLQQQLASASKGGGKK